MPGDSLESGVGDGDQSWDDDKDVDRSPADNEDGNHYEDHASDSTQIPVFLLCVKKLSRLVMGTRLVKRWKREKNWRRQDGRER